MTRLRLATRGSQLALYQARAVASRLKDEAGVECEMVVIKTAGDRLAEAPLSEVGGKRLFVKEIEDALLAGDVDLAVHSSKDLPAVLPEGLAIGAVLPREDPRDAVILGAVNESSLSRVEDVIALLGQSPRIGTSSVRRVAQLTRLWPGANFVPVRGNLDTRLRKLDAGEYDALVLAAAGIKRLGFDSRISLAIPVQACVPAPGQGIITIEIQQNAAVQELVTRITDADTAAALEAERAVVEAVGGGCQLPLGALAQVNGASLDLQAVVISADGRRALRGDAHGSVASPAAVGRRVADRLIADGAMGILDEVRRARAQVAGLQP